MRKKQQRLVRIIAIALAILLAGGAIVSAVISIAYAEEAEPSDRNQYSLTMEYLGEEQALRVSQRLVYLNDSGIHLDRVVFYAPGNLFRRQSALMYDGEQWAEAFPAGYLPGGIDLQGVWVDGAEADWGFQGSDEIYLRVACDLEPGDSCEFSFNYYLLLTENCAFMGISELDWRLSDFYFAPAYVDPLYGEFMLSTPTSFTRWIHSPAADFTATIALPELYLLSATGIEQTETDTETHVTRWTVTAENVRSFALNFGLRYRQSSRTTASGVELRAVTNLRGKTDRLLDLAEETIETLETWFGPFPTRQLDIVQADIVPEVLVHSGCIWLSEDALKSDNLEQLLRAAIARQYFGLTAYARPGADAWLSDAVSEYVGYLLLEESEGNSAYLAALNENVVPALQLTIPGGLVVTSDASLFTSGEYDIVVRDRGAAVFHELRTAMGRDELIAGLRAFYELGLRTDVLTEMDLVRCLDETSGKSWEKFLTDWVFNIGDYVDQTIDWLD
ncbi:MAG: hypothetical protein Q4G06_09995 [Clostridia bacterium]|nr:hypothetical protein [Clostridia bacterium]